MKGALLPLISRRAMKPKGTVWPNPDAGWWWQVPKSVQVSSGSGRSGSWPDNADRFSFGRL